MEELATRAESLNAQLTDPAIAVDPNKSIPITKELGRLRRLVGPFGEFRKVQDSLTEVREILADRSQDAELRATTWLTTG